MKNHHGAVYTVDLVGGGIAFGQYDVPNAQASFPVPLKLDGLRGGAPTPRRFVVHKEHPVEVLERQMEKISRAGVLSRSVVHFGVESDPLLPFETNFDLARRFLEVFERFQPGMLHIQTRSSLIVLFMQQLQSFGKKLAVTLGVETHREDIVKRYTPALPPVGDRLRAARALRACGIETIAQVNPILPYGDWRADAPEFASLLCDIGDTIQIHPACGGSERDVLAAKRSPLLRRLATDRQYFYLRPDTALPLLRSVENIAQEKLVPPIREQLFDRQLSIFAA